MLQFSWGNPINWLVGPVIAIDANGAETPVIDGTITGFLAVTDPEGDAVHAGASAAMTYVGDQPGRQAGQWNFPLPPMTKEYFDTHFRGKRVWFVMLRAGAKRETIEVQAKPARSMVLAA